jgi:NDP-sugar pyrophosphorylase family protein
MTKAGILAAGDGTRLRSISLYKPIVQINNISMLELTLKNLHFKNFENIAIIFNESEKNMDLALMPSLKNLQIDYFFKSTISSMHSLYEIAKRLKLKADEHFFVSMVDSIVKPTDAENFHLFCRSLKADESAIMVTTYIDDEKPLTLKTNIEGYVTEFQCKETDGVLITSGVYYFSEHVIPLLEKLMSSDQTKMRTFLTELVLEKHKIKVFQVSKTLDIDRPNDIKNAENFLKEYINAFES